MWKEYKKLRNQVSNRIRYEETHYKKQKIVECGGSSSKTWKVSKRLMNWSSSGPPTQLEVLINNKITLCTKAADIAHHMNEFFVSKINELFE